MLSEPSVMSLLNVGLWKPRRRERDRALSCFRLEPKEWRSATVIISQLTGLSGNSLILEELCIVRGAAPSWPSCFGELGPIASAGRFDIVALWVEIYRSGDCPNRFSAGSAPSPFPTIEP